MFPFDDVIMITGYSKHNTVIINFQRRYLGNQTLWDIKILYCFTQQGPVKKLVAESEMNHVIIYDITRWYFP